MLSIIDIKKELEHFYPIDFSSLSDEEIQNKFDEHVKNHAIEMTMGEIFSHKDKTILIDTPDGFQEIGDFYHKDFRDIYELKLVNGYKCHAAEDHLYETSKGWVHAKDLTKNDIVLTKNGFFNVKRNKKVSCEKVYDWEILHTNHRYWAGDGISSHNTGKTFLTLNVCREAQNMGYNVIYCDSEAAVDEETIKNFGVDPNSFRYQPVSSPHEVRHFVTNLCQQLKAVKAKGIVTPKILLVLDSLGNLATTKERNDAASGSDKRDMTKQQEIRSLFRVITTDLAEFKIPFIFTNHTYSCLLGDTLVMMADGSNKELKNIAVGDYLVTVNGPKEVQDIFKYDNVQTIKLYFENDIVIECSPLHKFLVNEDMSKEESWITAEELVEGDEVLLKE